MSQFSPRSSPRPESLSDRRRPVNRPFWPAFVWTATLLALSAGFLLGGFIFLLRAIGESSTEWQPAAAQAHGHIQIFGWGGLMVLGISLHFLPRLLSVQLSHPEWPRHILFLMGAGLVLRVLTQPGLAGDSSHIVKLTAAGGLGLSASLELIAATMVNALIGSLIWARRTAPKRAPSAGVTILIGTGFMSLQIAIITNWVGSIRSALTLRSLVSLQVDDATVVLGLVGFLIVISLAMSARLLPLYVQTGLPRERWLRAAAGMLIAGLVLGIVGTLSGIVTLAGMGDILQTMALICGVVALRVFERRRELPRRRVRVLTDPLQLHIVTAYAWLVAASCFSFFEGVDNLGLSIWSVPPDVQRHAIGAGFVTILILGVGAEMLPGLARSRIRWPRVRWLTLLCANVAALARVVPLVVRGFPGIWAPSIMSSAGAFGALAIALFLVNIPLKVRSTAQHYDNPEPR